MFNVISMHSQQNFYVSSLFKFALSFKRLLWFRFGWLPRNSNLLAEQRENVNSMLALHIYSITSYNQFGVVRTDLESMPYAF